MESYPVIYPINSLTGRDNAKQKLIARMVKMYNLTITHLNPSDCPCHGCAKRREWYVIK